MSDIKTALQEFVATYNDPKVNKDLDKTLSYFPELKGFDKNALSEYIATYEDPKVKGDWEKVNSYFPEFFADNNKTQKTTAPVNLDDNLKLMGVDRTPKPQAENPMWLTPELEKQAKQNEISQGVEPLSPKEASDVIYGGIPGTTKIGDVNIAPIGKDWQQKAANIPQSVPTEAIGINAEAPQVEMQTVTFDPEQVAEENKKPGFGDFYKAYWHKLNQGASSGFAGIAQYGEMVYDNLSDLTNYKWTKPLSRLFDSYSNTYKSIGDFFKNDAEFSRDRADIYKGKDYVQLMKEGRPLAAAGQVYLEATASAPTTLEAIALTAAGAPQAALPLFYVQSSGQKYDELRDKDMNKLVKGLNIHLTGLLEAATERFGDMVAAKAIVSKFGADKVKQAATNVFEKWIAQSLEKSALLTPTVMEGASEAANSLGQQFVDLATGVDTKIDGKEILDSFVFGIVGGAQFGAIAAGKGQYDKIKAKRQAESTFNDADRRLTAMLSRNGFTAEEVQDVKNSMLQANPENRNDVVLAIAQAIPEAITRKDGKVVFNPEIGNVFTDFYIGSDKLQSVNKAYNETMEAERAETIRLEKENAAQELQRLAGPDGMIRTVKLKDGTTVQVRGESMVFDENGMFDMKNSSTMLYYTDEAGQPKMMKPYLIESLVEEKPIEQAAMEADEQIDAAIIEQEIDDFYPTQPETYETNDGVIVVAPDEATGTLMAVPVDPATKQPIGDPYSITDAQYAEISGKQLPESIKTLQNEPINEGSAPVVSGDMTESAPVTAESTPVQPQYPVNKKGEVDVDAMTVAQAYQYMVDKYGQQEAVEALQLQEKNTQAAISANIKATDKFKSGQYAEVKKATTIQEQLKIREKHKATAQKLTDERAVLDAQLAEIRALMPQVEQTPAQPEVMAVKGSNVRPEEQFRREQEAKAAEQAQTQIETTPVAEVDEQPAAEVQPIGKTEQLPTIEIRSKEKKNIINPWQKRLNNLGDAMTVEDVVLRRIAGGAKFVWTANAPLKGMADELGFANKPGERELRKSMIDNENGITPQEFAHVIFESGDLDFMPGVEYQDVYNAVLDTLLSVNSATGALEMAEQIRDKRDFSMNEQAEWDSMTEAEMQYLEEIPDDILESYLGITNFTPEQLDIIQNLQNEYYGTDTTTTETSAVDSTQGIESETAAAGTTEEPISKEQQFDLTPAESFEQFEANVSEILKQYSGREMAFVQVELYLNEKPEFGKQFIDKHGITNREELKAYTAKLQAKLREGKGKERSEFIKEQRQERAEKAVSEIEKLALEANAAMLAEIDQADQLPDVGKKVEQPEAQKTKHEQALEERKQRILSKGTSFDEPFGLIPVSEIKTVEDIRSNVDKIISTLKSNEGNKKFYSFEGFAYGGKYAVNAGNQIAGYVISQIDVLPLELRKQFAESIGITNKEELISWAENEYKKSKPEAPKYKNGDAVYYKGKQYVINGLYNGELMYDLETEDGKPAFEEVPESELNQEQPLEKVEKPEAPKARPTLSFNNWKWEQAATNAIVIRPNTVGNPFTDEQFNTIMEWGEKNNFTPIRNSRNTRIEFVVDKLDNALVDYLDSVSVKAINDKKAADEKAKKDEAEKARKEELRNTVNSNPATSWINREFGEDAMNDYNKNALAKFLNGETKKFEGQVNNKWVDAITRLNALTEDGKGVDFDKLKKAYEQAPHAEQPLEKVVDSLPADNSENNNNFAKQNKENGLEQQSSTTVSESVPQGIDRKMPEGTRRTEEIETELKRRSEEALRNAQENSGQISERERIDIVNRTVEQYAKENGLWIKFSESVNLGEAGLSGTENDVYVDAENHIVYKVNNLIYAQMDILKYFDAINYHNELFPQTKYDIVGFTGFDNGTIYPVVKQQYVANANEASPEIIENYMNALGFTKVKGATYSNNKYVVSDLLPRNVLVTESGNVYVIDGNVTINQNYASNNKPEAKPATSEATQLVTASTELASAKAKYDKAQAKYLDLKNKLEKDPAFGIGGQTDIFGNVSGADNLFGNDGQKQAVEAVQAAKKAADDLKPAVDELQAKVDRLKEAVQDKVRGQQEVKFEEKPQSEQPLSEPDNNAGEENAEVNEQEEQEGVEQIEKLQDFGQKIGAARKDTAMSGFKKGSKSDNRPAWARKYQIYQDDYSFVGKDEEYTGTWNITLQPKNSRFGKTIKRGIKTYEEAEAMIPLVEASLNHRIYQSTENRNEYSIFRRWSSGKLWEIKKGFKSYDEAMKYMALNPTEIIEFKTARIERPHLDKLERTGLPERKGNVTPEKFLDTFGFRGGEFGNWVASDERQEMLNMAYDAFSDMANVLGISPKALSLNGRLAIGFGSRGQGLSGAAAHYEADRGVINLTKINGAGALAHEWAHAFDSYFGTMNDTEVQPNENGVITNFDKGKNFLSGENYNPRAARRNPENPTGAWVRFDKIRPEVYKAWKEVWNAMRYKTQQSTYDKTQAQKRFDYTLKAILDKLSSHRSYISRQREWGAKKNAATPEQLKQWDALVERVKNLDLGEQITIENKNRRTTRLADYAFDVQKQLSDLKKKIDGRSISDLTYSDFANLQQRVLELKKANEGETFETKVSTTFYTDSKEIDKSRASGYWSTNHEMTARAFESFIYDMIKQSGGRNDFLVHSVSNAPYILMYDAKPYPEGEERTRINEKLKNLFEVIQEDENGVMFQAIENDNKLVVLHNIRAEGILNVDKLGALPMPSLAITKPDMPLTGYGEITLIGDKRMVDPLRGTRTFGADIYSARYPELSYTISKQGEKVIQQAVEILPVELQGDVWRGIEQAAEKGKKGIVDSNSLKTLFLAEQGKLDEILAKEQSEYSQSTVDAIAQIEGYDYLDVMNNAEIRKQLTDIFFAEKPALEKFRERFTDENGILNDNSSRQLFDGVKRYLRVANRIDRINTYRNASDYIVKNNMEEEWRKYATEFYDKLGVKEEIFKGYNNQGFRKYVAHTIDNVMKAMKTKNLRGAEQFFYGSGSVRARIAPEFKSISDIKANADKLTDKETFEKIKTEIDNKLTALQETLDDFFKTKGNYRGSFTESLADEIITLANKGQSESFSKLSKEARTELVEFIEMLKNAPTEYFEAKPTREVYLSEFTAAVVPADTDQNVIEVLENAGLKVDRYTDNRAEVVQRVAERENVQFQTLHTGTTMQPATNTEVAATVEQLLKTGLAKEVRMVTPEEIRGILEGTEKYQIGSSKSFIPNVRGGWTKEKIVKYLKSKSSDTKSNYGIVEAIADYDSFEDFKNHVYYHGTTNSPEKGLKPSITMSERQAEMNGGGGYGERYYGVSLTKSKRVAEHFSGTKSFVDIYPVLLKKDAVIENREDLEDASEVEDIIVDLYNKGVDAVWIGGGEQELVVINPYAAILYKNGRESFKAFGGFKSIEPTEEALRNTYEKAKREYPELKKQYTSLSTKDERNNFLYKLDSIQFLRTPSGTIYGFVKGGVVYLNSSTPNLNTPIHEFGHLWIDAIEGTELYNRGAELVKDTPYWERVNSDPNYKDLSETARTKEAMAMAIGDKGEAVVKNKGLLAKLKSWIADVWKTIGAKFGIQNLTPEQIENLTFEQFTDIAVSELLSGEKLAPKPTKGGTMPATIDVDGIQRPTTNSNGKPIHSTVEGIRNFWRWFGNSKVTDEQGRPLVVNHGSRDEFTTFDKQFSGKSNSLASVGFWFSDVENFGERWAENSWGGNSNVPVVYNTYLKLENPFIYESSDYSKELDSIDAEIYELKREKQKLENSIYIWDYNAIEAMNIAKTTGFKDKEIEDYYRNRSDESSKAIDNGFKLRELSDKINKLQSEYYDKLYTDSYQKFKTDVYKIAGMTSKDANIGGLGMAIRNKDKVVEEYVSGLKEKGNDGIIIKNTSFDKNAAGGIDNNQYVVFDNTQIKSATGNIGGFDPKDANILHEPTQTFIKFTPEEQKDETDKAYGSEEKQQEAIDKTIAEAEKLKIEGSTGLIANRRPEFNSPVLSKRTVLDEFKESGYVNFVGQKINTHQDIADMWSIHRSPYIEKAHVIFVNDKNEIVGTIATTSNHASQARLTKPDEIIEHAQKVGATGVYMLHNHPSGNPTQSSQDVKATFGYNEYLSEAGIGLKGHLVLDHDKYTFIEPSKAKVSVEWREIYEGAPIYDKLVEQTVSQHEYSKPQTRLFTEREAVGDGQEAPARLFEIGKNLLSEPTYKAAIIYLQSTQKEGFNIAAYDIVPEGATKEDIVRIANEGLKNNLGASAVIAHDGSFGESGWRNLNNRVLDVINTKNESHYFSTVNEPVEKYELWVRQVLGVYGARNLDAAEEATTRLDNLAIAKEMESATKTPQEIRLATGWERGVDGLWRYEVPDGNFKNIKYSLSEIPNDEAKLSDIWDDDKLFTSYPQLKNITVKINNNTGYGGSYIKETNTIEINLLKSVGKEGQKSTLIHEIQHAIQEIEGFAKGGNVENQRTQRNYLDEYKALVDGQNYNELSIKYDNGELSGKEKEDYEKLDKHLKNLLEKAHTAKKDAYEKYRKLSGEVEARNASTRMNMSEEERRQTLLSATADVAPEDQIVLMDATGVSMSMPEKPQPPVFSGREDVLTRLKQSSKYAKELQKWQKKNIENIAAQVSESEEVNKKLSELNKSVDKWSAKLWEGWADGQKPVKKWQNFLKANGVEINDANDYYMRFTMMPGRVEYRFAEFDKTYLKPFIEILKAFKDRGVDYDALGTYAKLKHADEYTEHVMNQKMAERGWSDNRINLYTLQQTQPADVVKKYWYDWAEKRILNLKNDNAAKYEQAVKSINEQRDRAIEEVTPDFAGKRAIEERLGMSAEQYIADIESIGKANGLTDMFWKQVKRINEFSLMEEVRSGRRTAASAEQILSTFEWYVPLKNHYDMTAEDTFDYSTERGQFFVTAVKRGKGRRSESGDPFSVMVSTVRSSIGASEENTLKQALLRLAELDNTGSTTVSKAWFKKTGEDADGKHIFEVAPTVEWSNDDTQETYNEKVRAFEMEMQELAAKGEAYRGKIPKLKIGVWIKPTNAGEHEVHVMRNGEMYVIRFNTSPRVPQAVNKVNYRYYEGFTGAIFENTAKLTRFMAATKTMFRPTFIFITNPLRDIHHGVNLAYINRGAKFTAQAVAFLPIAATTLMRRAAGKINVNNKYDMALNNYMLYGAKTGISKILELKQMERSLKSRMTNKPHLWSRFKNVYQAVSEITENQMRFAVYLAALKNGDSTLKAVSMAKQATVNFDLKGNGRNGLREISSLYAFVRVGFQAIDGLYSASTQSAETKRRFAVAATMNILGGMVLTGAISSLIYNLFKGDDDEEDGWINDFAKLSTYERNSNFLIWTPDGVAKYPLGQEFRVFHGLGMDMLMLMHGKATATETAINFGKGISSLLPYNPIESAVMGSWGSAMPDVVSPWAEWAANRDWMGTRIYKENQDEDAPGYMKVRTNKRGEYYASEFMYRLSKALDKATGGDEAVKGWFSPNPDVAEHLVGGYLNGLLSQTLTVADFIINKDPKEFIPSAIWKSSDDIRQRTGGLNEVYYDVKEATEETKRRADRYEEAKDELKNEFEKGLIDPETYNSSLKRINNSLNALDKSEYYTHKGVLSTISELEAQLKANKGDRPAQQRIETSINELKEYLAGGDTLKGYYGTRAKYVAKREAADDYRKWLKKQAEQNIQVEPDEAKYTDVIMIFEGPKGKKSFNSILEDIDKELEKNPDNEELKQQAIEIMNTIINP